MVFWSLLVTSRHHIILLGGHCNLPNYKASSWKKSFYCNIMLNVGWRFSIQAEKVRKEWWLSAGNHWGCDLILQTGRIQNGSCYHHPFLYFFILRVEGSFPSLPFFLPFFFPASVPRHGNSISKLCSLSLIFFPSFLSLLLLLFSLSTSLWLSYFSCSPWILLCGFLPCHACSLW